MKMLLEENEKVLVRADTVLEKSEVDSAVGE